MDNRDFHELLQRYERQSYRAGRVDDLERRLGSKEDALARAKGDLAQTKRDLEAAEKKIEEWAAYAADLRARVNWRRQTDVPVLPKPLETEIPF